MVYIKKLAAAAVLASCVLVMALAVRSAVSHDFSFDGIVDWANECVSQGLKSQEWLSDIAPELLKMGGLSEQNGIYIAEDQLLKKVQPADDAIVRQNIEFIKAYLAPESLTGTLTLIPSASVIKQQELPNWAGLYNQKEMIKDTYSLVSGDLTTVDCYPELFSASDQYIYYRTSSNLTALGGYYVYSSLAPKLGLTARPLSQFEAEHIQDDYYGELYEQVKSTLVSPDIVTLYRYSRYRRYYRVIHIEPDGESKMYNTLYPTHLDWLLPPEERPFGGRSPIISIDSSTTYNESLLIVGDRSALAYLSFLTPHYNRVVVLDSANVTAALAEDIDPSEFDQIILSYYAEDFGTKHIGFAQ